MEIRLDFVPFVLPAAADFFCSWMALGSWEEQWWLSTTPCVPALSWDHCTVENRTTGHFPAVVCIFPSFSQHPFVPASIKHWFYHMQFHVPGYRDTETLWADGWQSREPSQNLFAFSGMCIASSLSHPSSLQASDLPFSCISCLLILQFIDLLSPPCVASYPKLNGAAVGF